MRLQRMIHPCHMEEVSVIDLVQFLPVPMWKAIYHVAHARRLLAFLARSRHRQQVTRRRRATSLHPILVCNFSLGVK